MENEICEQVLIIEKIKKEKKQLQDNLNKSSEDIQSSESKNNHLNNVKSKLEHTLDELEDELQKEKKAKGELEKCRRKLEADLRLSLEVGAEKDKEKNVWIFSKREICATGGLMVFTANMKFVILKDHPLAETFK